MVPLERGRSSNELERKQGGTYSFESVRVFQALPPRLLTSSATTSGGENDREELEPEWKPPDEELIRKLVDQIEFYFSDENLEKDAFLLKHVRRNKLGYVSVKLLTSFKKAHGCSEDASPEQGVLETLKDACQSRIARHPLMLST